MHRQTQHDVARGVGSNRASDRHETPLPIAGVAATTGDFVPALYEIEDLDIRGFTDFSA